MEFEIQRHFELGTRKECTDYAWVFFFLGIHYPGLHYKFSYAASLTRRRFCMRIRGQAASYDQDRTVNVTVAVKLVVWSLSFLGIIAKCCFLAALFWGLYLTGSLVKAFILNTIFTFMFCKRIQAGGKQWWRWEL